MPGIQLLSDELRASNLNAMLDGLLNIDGNDYEDETLIRGIYTLLKNRLTFSLEPNRDINSRGLSTVMVNKTDYPSDGWVSIDGEAYDAQDHFCLFVKDNNGVWTKPDTMFETTPDDGFINISTIESYDAEYSFIGSDSSILEGENNVVKYNNREDIIFMSLYKKVNNKDITIHVMVHLATGTIYTVDLDSTGADLFGDGVVNYVRINTIDKIIVIDNSIDVLEVISFLGGIDTFGGNNPAIELRTDKLSLYQINIDRILGSPTPQVIDYGLWSSNEDYIIKSGLNEINHNFIPNTPTLVGISQTIDGSVKPTYIFGNGDDLKTWYKTYVGVSDDIDVRDLYDKYLQLDRYQMYTPINIVDAPTSANNIVNLAYLNTLTPVSTDEDGDIYKGYTYNALNYDYKALALIDITNYKTVIPNCTYINDDDYKITRKYPYSDDGTIGLEVSINSDVVYCKHYNKGTLPILDMGFKLPNKGHGEFNVDDDKLLLRSFKAHYVEPQIYDDTKYTIPTNALMPIFVFGDVSSTFILTLEGYFYADSTGIISATFEKVINYSYVDTYCIFKTIKNTYIYDYTTHTIKPLNLTSLSVQDIAINTNGQYGLLTDGFLRIYSLDGTLLFQENNVEAIVSIGNIIAYCPSNSGTTNVKYFNDGASHPTSCYLNQGKVTEQGVGGFNCLFMDENGIDGQDSSYGNGDNSPLRYPTSVQFDGFKGLEPNTIEGMDSVYDIWERPGHIISAVRLNGEIYIKNIGPRTVFLEKFIGTDLSSGQSRQFLPNEKSCKLI